VEEWAELDDDKCACHGTGWVNINADKTVECPIHFVGQLHPETQALLYDEPNRLAEEERKARLRFLIRETRNEVVELQTKLKAKQENLVKLELELINRTPTVRAIQVVVPVEPETMEEDGGFL
jgi:hypothetical protein